MTDNVSTNIICLLIMLSLSGVIKSQRRKGPAGTLYYAIGLATLFSLFIEILASVNYTYAWIPAQIILVLYYSTMPLLGALWIVFIYVTTCPEFGKREKRIAPWLMTPFYIYAAACLTNPFTHIVFSLTKDMQFVRHDTAYLRMSVSTYALLSIIGLVVIIKHYKSMKHKYMAGILLSYVFMIGCAIWAQANIEGWLVINACMTVVYVITYFTIQNRKVSTLAKDLEESERIKAEAVARAMAEERFRLVARDSNDIVFEINLVKNTVVANENYYKVFGEEAEFDLLWEEKTIHPDDRQKFREVKHRLLNAEKGVPLELRLKTKCGEYEWFMLTISAFTDDNGYITRVMGKYSDIDLRTHEREILQRRAQLDDATGLFNKTATEELITLALQDCDDAKHSAVLIADIDDLKIINDTLGHAEGDRAIYMVANVLKMHFRATDIVGRIGGDEFLILLNGMYEEDKLKATLAALSHKVASLRVGENNDYPVRCSIGIVFARSGDTFENLYVKADKALYYVKRDTKNAYAIYNPEMENSNYEYRGSEANIRNAVMFDAEETALLLYSLAEFYPFIASANLVQNSYYMLEYLNYGISFGTEIGEANSLLAAFSESAHPAERDDFRAVFNKGNMQKVFADGEKLLLSIVRQRLPSGLFRWAKVAAVLTENLDGELCAMFFMRPVGDRNAL
ncbi:MAG: diguanylate cyclase [Clostridia bacterium]|nr:diguanylate cyclase [Clostridia bacterium]